MFGREMGGVKCTTLVVGIGALFEALKAAMIFALKVSESDFLGGPSLR